MKDAMDLSEEDIDYHVGGQLRSKRSILGISQETLGQELGVSFQQVQKYEKGINRISASKIYKASLAIKEPVSYFFSGLPGQGAADSPFALHHTHNKDTIELLKAFYKIKDPNMRIQLKNLIKALLKE